jgi:hypothetical protein
MALKAGHYVIAFFIKRIAFFHGQGIPQILLTEQECSSIHSKLTSCITQDEWVFDLSSSLSIFKDEETKSKFWPFYKESLAAWPIRYEEFMVPTCYGDTDVIACGPRDGDPIVLVHAAGVNGTMWAPNESALSRQYRVCAFDTIGDFEKSILNDLQLYPKSAQDYSRWLIDVFDGIGTGHASVVGSSMGDG